MPAHAPNTPVNAIVGALLIKEILHVSDDGIVTVLSSMSAFSVPSEPADLSRLARWLASTLTELQGAAFERQDIESQKGKRFCEYERETGIDLMHECIAKLDQHISRLIGITRLSAWTPCGIAAHPQRIAQPSSARLALKGIASLGSLSHTAGKQG